MGTRCTKRGSKITVLGNHNKPASRSIGVSYNGTPSLTPYSEEKPPEKVNLRAAQTRAARKAPKPTLPKMPWD